VSTQNENRIAVNILDEHYREIQRIIDESTKFDSVESFVDFVLQQVLTGTHDATDDEIKRRLSDLGYL
jgi:hypothetical protein